MDTIVMERITHAGAVVLAVFLVCSLFAGVAPAASHGGADMDELVSQYNANVDEAPGLITNRLAGERVELRFGSGDSMASSDSGSAHHFDIDSDGTVTDHSEGAPEDPTIRVLTSENTIDEILASDDPGSAFNEAYNNDEIRIEGVGVVNSVKIGVTKAGFRVGSSLGLF